jgi:hypothetical protein
MISFFFIFQIVHYIYYHLFHQLLLHSNSKNRISFSFHMVLYVIYNVLIDKAFICLRNKLSLYNILVLMTKKSCPGTFITGKITLRAYFSKFQKKDLIRKSYVVHIPSNRLPIQQYPLRI